MHSSLRTGIVEQPHVLKVTCAESRAAEARHECQGGVPWRQETKRRSRVYLTYLWYWTLKLKHKSKYIYLII